MRITTTMMTRNLINRLNANTRRVQKYQEQLSTGRYINRPSDDPVGTTSALRLRSALTEVERYNQNLENAKEWMLATEEALGKLGDALTRCRELATSGANTVLPPESRESIAKELDQIYEHLVYLANSEHGGRYLFAGQNTLTAPFTLGGPSGVLDTGAILREVGPGQVMQINITGQFLTGPTSMLTVIPNVATQIRNGDTAAVSASLADIEKNLDEVLSYRAEMGAKVNRMDMLLERSLESKVNLTRLLTSTEDADIAELALKLAQEEASYKAALAVGARLIQPTLVDFLR